MVTDNQIQRLAGAYQRALDEIAILERRLDQANSSFVSCHKCGAMCRLVNTGVDAWWRSAGSGDGKIDIKELDKLIKDLENDPRNC